MGDRHGSRYRVLHSRFQSEASRLGGNCSGALIRLKGVAELDEALSCIGRSSAVADGRAACRDLAGDKAAHKAIINWPQAVIHPSVGEHGGEHPSYNLAKYCYRGLNS